MSTTAQYTPKDIDRFYAKVSTIPTEQGCLEWMAYHNSQGYGRFQVGGKFVSAHRVAWEIINGPVPPGLVIRHFVCSNPRCCRVEHLRLGTYADNAQDMVRSGRYKNAPNTTTPYVKPTDEERFYATVSKTPTDTGCLEWTGPLNGNGYGRFSVGGKRMGAHRAAWELAHGDIPAGMLVLHRCDNRKCCRVEHLFVGSQTDNMHDMDTKGRRSNPPIFIGEQGNNVKLTAAKILEMRSGKFANWPYSAIAKHFGIGHSQVGRILHHEAWAHLDAPDESNPINGERNRRAKLTAEQVSEIRSDLYIGWKQIDIAQHFGVSQSLVSAILSRKRWAHI